MEHEAETSTIFDDVFRTIALKLPELLVPLVNEAFGTDYPEDVNIEHLQNESYQSNGREKRITDTYLKIREKIYHIECQSENDNTMVLRMIEYDFRIALDQAELSEDVYTIRFPQSAVLYLRHGESRSDRLKVYLALPDGQTAVYWMKAVRLQKYNLDEIFMKKLLIFLPFYILRYERAIRKNHRSSRALRQMLKDYRKIMKKLDDSLLPEGRKALYVDLRIYIQRILDYVMRDNEEVRKEMEPIMGGKILELESERLIRIGEDAGYKRGEDDGVKLGEERLSRLMNKLLELGLIDDIKKATDSDYRQSLYKKYGI